MPPAARLHLTPPLRSLLSRVAAVFGAHGAEAYATGGFLRDTLLGLPVHDVDISVRGDPLALGPALARAFRGRYFPLDEERRLVRVLLPERGLHIDLQPLRADVEADLRTRDFTIDALAAPLAAAAAGKAGVIDPAGGMNDLAGRIVRAVSEDALRRDPLRLLRGARIAAQLGFQVEPGTAELIRRHAALVTQAAVERQRDEIMCIFGVPLAGTGLRLLDELGLLPHVLPEMEAARGAEQPKEHHWDVLGHSLAVVEDLDFLLAEDEPLTDPAGSLWRDLWTQLDWWHDAPEYFREEVVPGSTRGSVLKLTGFLHDIGKPATKSFDQTGRMRFFGHSEAGAEMAAGLMRRLRFSSREVGIVRAMIEAHLRPVQMAQQGAPTRRAVYRFFRDTGEAGIDTLFLSLADHLGTVGPRLNPEGWRQHAALTSYILEKRLQNAAVVSPPKLLRGDDLIAELKLSPGPLVGTLLEAVREAQAAGEIATREEALELARRMVERSGSA